MKKRFIAVAVPVLIAGSLAATAPSTSQAAGGDPAARQQAPTLRAAQTTLGQCTGGAQKKAVTGGSSDYVGTGSSKVIPGTVVQFRGPDQGKDALFVTVTAPWTYVSDPGDLAQVRVELDGVDLKPGSLAPEYRFSSNNNVSGFTGQYCAKITSGGFHQVRLVLDHVDDGDGSGESYLFNPMIHVEVAE